MGRLSYVLQPRRELFRQHDLRLRTSPDPENARRMFDKRLGDARRAQKYRLVSFIGIYFSIIITVIGASIAVFFTAPWLENGLGALSGVVSSLTLVFLSGVFVTTRFLNHFEVDLHFYSDESRLTTRAGPARRTAVPVARSQGTPRSREVRRGPTRV